MATRGLAPERSRHVQLPRRRRDGAQMRKLIAKRKRIPPHSFFGQHEIDPAKVDAIRLHLKAGGSVPPVVAVQYGTEFMPLDGHHRLLAAEYLGMTLDAWVVDGAKFETLDQQLRAAHHPQRAEDLVTCDGVPAMKVCNIS